MPKNSKFAGFTRSRLVIALTGIERRLESVKYGSPTDRALRAERAQLFETLREIDNQLIAKFWGTSNAPR